ncbi:Zn-ribbon domain-containing OB-fold protein [Halobellus rubicundus]|uniref:Zn-ribbon domain-containing OB-fold protein n=1 Tax=Halobellus rubicundus TaxID=2996466 RepID=A0ABD5M9R7_9EURY
MTGTRDGSPDRNGLRADEAFECPDCGARWYYTRHRCPDCGEREAATVELGVGELVAATRVEVTPADVRSPNRLGVAAFGDVRLVAQIDGSDVDVGDRVAFDGAYALREGDERREPRLTAADESDA